jgi:hypothetical protein
MTLKIAFQKESTEGFDEKETKKIFENYINAGEKNAEYQNGGEER